jgi:hypothetical protein
MHKKVRDYSNIKLDLPEKMEAPERKRIKSELDIDFSVFRKSTEERQRLKDAKAGLVTFAPVPKKKTRGGWEWRMRKRLKGEGLSYEEIELQVKARVRANKYLDKSI